MSRGITIPLATLVLLACLFIFPVLRSPLFGSNLFTLLIMLVLLFGDAQLSLISAVAGGFITDLVSPYPFGTYTVSMAAAVMVVHWIFRVRFTNRSLLAYLLLTALGLALQSGIAHLYSFGVSLADASSIPMHADLPAITSSVVDLLRGLVLALVVYIAVRFTGHSYATLTSREF